MGRSAYRTKAEDPVSILNHDFFIPMIIQIAEWIRAI